MFRTHGEMDASEDHVDMSFRDTRQWLSFALSPETADYDVALNLVLIGDEDVGPVLFLTHAKPGVRTDRAVAHAHASDNWRISLRGEMHVGLDVYRSGAFRLQEGWKGYPDDDSPRGPDGGWGIVMMADRRGTRRRLAVEPIGFEYAEESFLRGLARDFGFSGDVFSDDPAAGAGPSALASTIGPPDRAKLRLGKLNASFAESALWDAVSADTRIAVTLLGDRMGGPVLVFTDTRARALVAPRHRFGTEALHIVVEGGCRIGGAVYRPGDMRMQHANRWCEPIEALDEGLKTAIVFGDRRCLDAEAAPEGWLRHVTEVVERLLASLEKRKVAA